MSAGSGSSTQGASAVVARRMYGVSVGYGLLAGGVTGVTFFLMRSLQHLIWGHIEAWWYTAVIVLLGGAIIAVLRSRAPRTSLDEQVVGHDAAAGRWRSIALVGLSAVVAIGFGGAIGPEAGLLAVVAELSVVVRAKVARTREEGLLIAEAGSAAALSGFYGSPPVGAVYRDDAAGPGRLPLFCASLAGFVGFVLTWRLLGLESHPLDLPDSVPATAPNLLVVVPAVMGAALAVGYLFLCHSMSGLLGRAGSPLVQTLLGSAVLAPMLATWPILRFSGHDDFGVLSTHAAEGAWWLLLALGLGKAAATALFLASGWRGGDFFPLMFAGAAVGAAALALLPQLGVQAAMVAGMAAATTVGLRKPMAVLVLLWFLVPDPDVVALAVACVCGVLVLKTLPDHPALAPHAPPGHLSPAIVKDRRDHRAQRRR